MAVKEVNLAKLAEMTPEQRRQRLHGIAEPTRLRLLQQCNEVLTALVNEDLRKRQG